MKKSKLKEIIKSLVEEVKKEEEIDEMTTTQEVEPVNIPSAFRKKGSKNKKLQQLMKGRSLEGMKVVKEDLNNQDVKLIRTMIRDVIADVLRDIWIKRNSWKKSS